MAGRDDEAFYTELESLHVIPLWRRNDSSGPAQGGAQPMLWRWSDIRDRLFQASRFDLGPQVERRVLSFKNPGVTFTAAATGTLGAGVQMILPGETAPPHRHTMAALRFIIEGEGAWTVVNGERLDMQRGDLILTPRGTWHEHRHDGSGPMFWLDGLDAPFVRSLGSVFFERHPDEGQKVSGTGDGLRRFGTGGILPARRPARSDYSPLLCYRFEAAYKGCKDLLASGVESAFDGARVEYVNPLDGGHVMQTIACYLDLLRPGLHTKAHRHISSTVYHVAKGTGQTIIEGKTFDWTAGDTLAVPSWAFHEHISTSSDEAVLFAFSDAPIFEAFGLEREETLSTGGGHQSAAS